MNKIFLLISDVPRGRRAITGASQDFTLGYCRTSLRDWGFGRNGFTGTLRAANFSLRQQRWLQLRVSALIGSAWVGHLVANS